MDTRVGKIHFDRSISLAVKAHDPVLPGRGRAERVQVDAGGQHPSPVMVRMVSSDLRPSRRAEQPDSVRPFKGFLKGFQQRGIALLLRLKIRRAVQLRQMRFRSGGIQFFQPFFCQVHFLFLPVSPLIRFVRNVRFLIPGSTSATGRPSGSAPCAPPPAQIPSSWRRSAPYRP